MLVLTVAQEATLLFKEELRQILMQAMTHGQHLSRKRLFQAGAGGTSSM